MNNHDKSNKIKLLHSHHELYFLESSFCLTIICSQISMHQGPIKIFVFCWSIIDIKITLLAITLVLFSAIYIFRVFEYQRLLIVDFFLSHVILRRMSCLNQTFKILLITRTTRYQMIDALAGNLLAKTNFLLVYGKRASTFGGR